jgi:predicted nucleic acid-binding protein
MRSVVVDASVVVKWFFPEIHSEQALHLLDAATDFALPDLLYAEVGNVLWHRVRTGTITLEEAHTVVAALGALPRSSGPVPSSDLLASALEIACQTGTTVYDSLYLALALRDGTSCITADRKFYDRLQVTPFAPHVAWITDPLPAPV